MNKCTEVPTIKLTMKIVDKMSYRNNNNHQFHNYRCEGLEGSSPLDLRAVTLSNCPTKYSDIINIHNIFLDNYRSHGVNEMTVIAITMKI